MGTGVRIATASVRTGLAMTLVFHGGAVCGGAHGPRPTDAFSDKKGERRGAFSLLLEPYRSEILDDVNDFGTDALLSLQGGGADVSGCLENVPVAHF